MRRLVCWISMVGWIACGGTASSPDVSPDAPLEDRLEAGDVPVGEATDLDWEAQQCPLPPPQGPELGDLTPWARIRASGTQPRGLWPYEAEDGPATVRDGHPDTGWKVPEDEPESWIELDWIPWAKRPVSLSEIRWNLDGTLPSSVTVVGSWSCGGSETFRVAWEDPSSPLVLNDPPAGCLRIALRPSGPLAVSALEVLSHDALLALPDPIAPSQEPSDPVFRNSGVIEGFYGVPWSFRERREMLRTMAGFGLGTYLYAPKNDPLHRDRWREPYPEEFREEFRHLAAEARRLGVRLLFGISPFIDYRGDEADFRVLREKCRSFLEDGAMGIAILADDIEFAIDVSVDGSLGAMHTAVVNRLRQELGNPVTWFTPTVYSDRRAQDWPGGPSYLEALRDLHPEVVVQWTGPGTGNATLEAQDLASITARIERKPAIWDNFYANDGGDGFFGRLFLAPYQGRAPDLPAATAGIAQNLSIQGGLSRLALGTFGQWLAAPSQSSPQDLWRRAAEGEAARWASPGGNVQEDANLLVGLMEVFDGFSSFDPPRDRPLEEAIARVVASLDDTQVPINAEAIGALLDALIWRASLVSRVHHSGLQADLVDELSFPLEKVRHEARAGLFALAALAERLGGKDGSSWFQRAEEEVLESAQCRYVVSPDAISGLIEAVRKAPARDAGVRWLSLEAVHPACTSGRPLSLPVPPHAGARARAGGLPGADLSQAGGISWTPPHAGHYQGVLGAWVGGATPGWGFVDFSLDCRDPCDPAMEEQGAHLPLAERRK